MKNRCDHIIGIIYQESVIIRKSEEFLDKLHYDFNFCPDCGEKLICELMVPEVNKGCTNEI